MTSLSFALACLLLYSNSIVNIVQQDRVLTTSSRSAPLNGSQEFVEIVSFQNGIQSHLFFDGTGDVVRCQRYYKEKDLSPFVAAKVKYKYPGFKIFGVTEITTHQGVQYTIVLEDPKYWIHVQSTDNGTLTLRKKYKKA